MFVVFDLDGTLADITHRVHFVDKSSRKRDWRAFFDACEKDAPNTHIVSVLHAMKAAGHYIEIWSARSDEVREKTEAWLYHHGIVGIPLRMRVAGDYTPDECLKRAWLEQSKQKPELVFDDRAKVVDMWRSAGVPCCQVAPGVF